MSKRKIMVAVDASPIARNAFEWCLENLYRSGDVIIIIHCAEADPGFTLPGFFANTEAACKRVQEWQDNIDKLCLSYTEILKKKGIEGRLIKITGEKPGESIVKASLSEGVNSIVMGTRGLSKVQRVVLGSVSEFVIRNTNIAVTIVPKE